MYGSDIKNAIFVPTWCRCCGYFVFILLWHHIRLRDLMRISFTIDLRNELLKKKPHFVYFLGSIGGIRGLNYDLKVSVQTNE